MMILWIFAFIYVWFGFCMLTKEIIVLLLWKSLMQTDFCFYFLHKWSIFPKKILDEWKKFSVRARAMRYTFVEIKTICVEWVISFYFPCHSANGKWKHKLGSPCLNKTPPSRVHLGKKFGFIELQISLLCFFPFHVSTSWKIRNLCTRKSG